MLSSFLSTYCLVPMISKQLLFIVWEVDPVIFTFNFLDSSLPITWYGLFFALSFVLGQQLMYYIFKVENKPATDVDKLLMYVVLATIIGARLGHYLFYEWQLLLAHPWQWLSSLVTPPFAGLASHGAAIAIVLSLFLYSRKKSDQGFFWVTDRVAIVGSIGGLIRIGNLFNSEIYGEPTSLPWGFLFVRETDPTLLPQVPRHPTQLYEALFCLFLLGLLLYLWKYKRQRLQDGFITGVFLILLFSFRFLVELLKNNQAIFEENLHLNMGQILSVPAILAGIVILLRAKLYMKGPSERNQTGRSGAGNSLQISSEEL